MNVEFLKKNHFDPIQGVVDSLPGPAWVFFKTQAFFYLNQKAEKIATTVYQETLLTHPYASKIIDLNSVQIREEFHRKIEAKADLSEITLRLGSKDQSLIEMTWTYELSSGEGCVVGLLIPKSEHKPNHLFQSAFVEDFPDPLIIFSLAQFEICACNIHVCNLLNKRKEDLLGLDVYQIESHGDPERSEIHRRANFKSTQNFIFYIKDEHQKIKSMEASIGFFTENDLDYGVICFRDSGFIAEIDATNNVLAKALYESKEALMIVNTLGNITMINPSFSQMTGYTPQNLLQLNIMQIAELDNRNFKILRPIWDQFIEKGEFVGDVELYDKYGQYIYVRLSIFGVQKMNGQRDFVCLLSDRSEFKLKMDQLTHIAHNDALTGLPNRLLLKIRYDHILEHCKRAQSSFALMFFDLDNFKTINDTLGHKIGDEILLEFSKRVSKVIRASDTFARLGGDEFVLIAESTKTKQDTEVVILKILEALEEPVLLVDKMIRIQTSIGVSMYPQDGEDLETLLKHADHAMYEAKKSIHDNFAFYTRYPLT